jgi:hypothetical protein
MAINAFQTVTPSAKLAMVNNKLGNPGLKKNQGSTFEVYDYVDVTSTIGTSQVLRFFGNVNTKTFPLTNLQQNQLQVGEALSIEYIAFTRLEVDTVRGTLKAMTPLLNLTEFSLSQMSILLDNSRIIKTNSLMRSFEAFNTKGGTAKNFLFYPDTDLVIPPQISFTTELNIPTNTDTAATDTKVYYGCHLFGTGAILNLKTNV